jgi:hypothetical protein
MPRPFRILCLKEKLMSLWYEMKTRWDKTLVSQPQLDRNHVLFTIKAEGTGIPSAISLRALQNLSGHAHRASAERSPGRIFPKITQPLRRLPARKPSVAKVLHQSLPPELANNEVAPKGPRLPPRFDKSIPAGSTLTSTHVTAYPAP